MNTSSAVAPLLVIIVGVAACASAPVDPIAPPGEVIVRAHWDQACGDGRLGEAPFAVTELFDTVGLGAEISGSAVLGPYQRDRGASLDFVTRYGADGGIRAMGLWDASIDSAGSVEAVGLLRARARPVGRLLERVGIRTELTFFPTPRISVGPPVICEPHIVHRDGEPPEGLPDSVRLVSGRAVLGPGDHQMAELRLVVGRQGEVVSVERRLGPQATFAAAEALMRSLEYDPALRNGEPVERGMTQTVLFRAGSALSAAASDSIFLARRGYDMRAEHFPAITRRSDLGAAWDGDLTALLAQAGARFDRSSDQPRIALDGLDCPVTVLLNGAAPQSDPSTDRGTFLQMEPRVLTQLLTGLELYAPEAGVVADGAECGLLLAWSRELSGVVDAPLVGGLVVEVEGVDEGAPRVDVFLEPVGRGAFRQGASRFAVRRLLPGEYEVLVRRAGAVIATTRVVVAARGTAEVTVRIPGSSDAGR